MTPLEQELDDIKLGFRQIEKFDPYNSRGENSYDFFMRVYGRYREENVIYQADLLVIDNRLLKNLKDYFRRNRYTKYQINTLQELLPNKSERTAKILKQIQDKELSRQDISPLAATLIDNR